MGFRQVSLVEGGGGGGGGGGEHLPPWKCYSMLMGHMVCHCLCPLKMVALHDSCS